MWPMAKVVIWDKIRVMKRLSTLFQHVRIFQGKKDRPESFTEWPFFLILTFAFGFVYFQSILSSAALREPGRLILFTVLMSVHIALHWIGVGLRKWGWLAIYLAVQSALAFTVVYLGGNIGPLLALYMGLIGETIGLLREKPRWMVLVVTVLLGLSFCNYILLVGKADWYWWLLAMLPLTFFVAVYVVLYTRQAEARQQAQSLLRDLEAANRQLSEYVAQVEDLTLTAERQRMARELHDTLSQGLAGLILQLEAADAHLIGKHPERAQAIIQQSMEQARITLAEARQSIDNLRQPGERDLGEAARQEAEYFASSTGIPCDVEIALPVALPDPVAETAIRAISEGLANVARHAKAKNAILRVVTTEAMDELEINIRDDGIGFDLASVEAGHYGLLGMRERVRLAGGSFDVHSEVGKGTELVVKIPLENTADE